MENRRASKVFRMKPIVRPGKLNQAGSVLTSPADAPGGWVHLPLSHPIATNHGKIITIMKVPRNLLFLDHLNSD